MALAGEARAALPYVQLSMGESHGCGLLGNGEVVCWGQSSLGQAQPPPGPFLSVAAGDRHTCGIREGGIVECWGDPGVGQTSPPPLPFKRLGLGAEYSCGLTTGLEPVCWGAPLPGIPVGPLRAITRGRTHACGIRESGHVVCWGSNGFGKATPLPGAFVRVSGGGEHTCALRADGTAQCWGSNGANQSSPPPLLFERISAGRDHTCALDAEGKATCWGDDSTGEASPPLDSFKQISTGLDVSCGVRTDGVALCWGDNTGGKATPPSIAFPQVAAGSEHTCAILRTGNLQCWTTHPALGPPPAGTFVQVASGGLFSCAVDSVQGFVTCWGLNSFGQASAPPGVAMLEVAAGGEHACGLLVGGDLLCWGRNDLDQASPPPGAHLDVAAGLQHTCAVRADQSVVCFGDGGLGQTAPPGGPFTQVVAGSFHTCGLRPLGRVECWGSNDFGERTAPSGTFVALTAGGRHTCGRRPSGHVECWGRNISGETNVPSGPFAAVSAGGTPSDRGHNCALRPSGALVCWGDNEFLQSRPPFDFENDGFEDAADDCPRVPDPQQTDADRDGAGDACDRCPSLVDPSQFDRDADGRGDACDNCRDVFNPGQSDLDGNGTGDACEPAVFGLFPGGPGDYQLLLSCGAFPISRVQVGILIPSVFDPNQVSFGPGCTPSNCNNATGGLGPTVNPVQSNAQGPGLLTPPGVRRDTVYVDLVGNGHLCDPGQTVPLGGLEVGPLPPDPPTPFFTTQGLAPLGYTPALQEPNGPPVHLEDLVFSAGPVPSFPSLESRSAVAVESVPALELEISPALGEGASPTRWQVAVDSDLELHRVTFGLVGPAAVTTAQMRFVGCEGAPVGPANIRSCIADPELGPYVDPASSFTSGPPPNIVGRTDTLFVSVVGSEPVPFLSDRVNTPGAPTVLGVVELDTSPGVPPTLTLDKIGLVSGVGPNPIEESSGGPIAAGEVALVSTYQASDDFDSDGREDDVDNCPFEQNLAQANRGGFMTATPDAFGDTCQCGEGDDTGKIFDNPSDDDVEVLRDVLAQSVVAPGAASRCSVRFGTECDVSDVVVLRRALGAMAPGIQAVCTPAVRDAPPEDP